MNAEIENCPLLDEAGADAHPSSQPQQTSRWWIWLGAVVIGGYLLFAHGCHADEDTELLVPPADHGRGTSSTTGLGKNLMSAPSWKLANVFWF